MLKILIYDSGRGGELFADYLEKELATVEIIRLIDRQHMPHARYSREELRVVTEFMLYQYIGKVDAIVLASYIVTEAALDWLRKRYATQTFIGFEIRPPDIARMVKCSRILMLADSKILTSPGYLNAKNYLQNMRGIQVLEPDCHNWAALIDGEGLPDIMLHKALCEYDWKRDVVLLYNTHFITLKPRLERLLGWRMRLVDEFAEVFWRVHRALNLNRQYLRPAGTTRRSEHIEHVVT